MRREVTGQDVKKLTAAPYELCDPAGGGTLWQDALCRAAMADDRDARQRSLHKLPQAVAE